MELPVADGSVNQVLKTDGSGNLDWVASLLTDTLIENNSMYIGNDPSGTTSTAERNIGVGVTSLPAITTGDDNTALGYYSGKIITSGIRNTAFGSYSLYKSDTENDNTAIGYAALGGTINGAQYNVAAGNFTLDALTSGGGNTAIGYAALSLNGTGNSNVAVGYYALVNSTGGHNVAVGSGALQNNAGGNENTALGHNAGFEITSGENNLVIGKNAGRSTANGGLGEITTADNIIHIGNNTHTEANVKVAFQTPSDKRDKTAFKSLPHGLDFLNKLKPLSYKFRVDRNSNETSGPERYGFLAQEILELEGENPVIINNDDKENLKYNQSSLVPVLVKAVQEQQEMIDSLKKIIEDQNKRFEKIESLLLKKE
jgi:hypothetical protein